MLFTWPERGRALHIPALLLLISVLFLCGGSYMLLALYTAEGEFSAGSALSAAFGVFMMAMTLTQWRVLRVEGEQLSSRNIYGEKRLPISTIYLGISVQHSSRGGPTYTVYAQGYAGDEQQRLDLASTSTKKGAEKARAKLSEALLSQQLDSTLAQRARADVEARAARMQAQVDRSQAAINEYYASGKAKKMALWVILGVTLYILLMMGWFAWADR